MTPQELKNSILQLAIQGRLVEQRPEEGTAEELLEKIFAAKGGTRSRASPLMTGGTGATSGTGARPSRPARCAARPAGPASPASPTPVSPEEQPFEIPESWVWVRREELLLSQPSNGVSPHGVAYQTPYKNLTLTATTSGYFRPEAFKYVEVSSELAEKYYLHDEDILRWQTPGNLLERLASIGMVIKNSSILIS